MASVSMDGPDHLWRNARHQGRRKIRSSTMATSANWQVLIFQPGWIGRTRKGSLLYADLKGLPPALIQVGLPRRCSPMPHASPPQLVPPMCA